MILKTREYYQAKLETSQRRAAAIEKKLLRTSKTVEWKANAAALRAERFALIDDIKGYRVILAHIDSGIGLSRYHDWKHAARIINKDSIAERR